MKKRNKTLSQKTEREGRFSLLEHDLSLLDVSTVNLDDYNIHVIASVLKQWLRDLPSPLMTFELYEEFLRAMGKLIIIPFQTLLFAVPQSSN